MNDIMQIKLSYKEAFSIENVLRSLDENMLKELKKFKNTKGVKVATSGGDVVIDIAPECVGDIMNIYGKYLCVLLNQTKALVKTCMNYFEELEEVVTKYSEEIKEENEEKKGTEE